MKPRDLALGSASRRRPRGLIGRLTGSLWRPALYLGVFALGAWAWAGGLLPQLLSYEEDLVYLTGQHLELVAWSAGLAILTGLPVGVLLARPRFRRWSDAALQVMNIGTAIPTLAIIALSMTLLGIGAVPAIFGLWAATLLPIVRNTHAGLVAVPAHLLDAARGMGMTGRQIFWQVEAPNALFITLAGIRTALAINVGTVPLAFLIGAGGLGELIFTGIALNELPMMLAGALATALLAVLADMAVGGLQLLIVPRGINPLR